jgi:subtilisin
MSDSQQSAGPNGQHPENRSADRNDGAATIGTRQTQYMIGRREQAGISLMGAGPFDSFSVVNTLKSIPHVELVRVVKESNFSLQSGSSNSHDIVVVRTASPEGAASVESIARQNPGLIVERDRLLNHLGSFSPQFLDVSNTPSQLASTVIPTRFHVRNDGGEPVAAVTVIIYSDLGTEDKGMTNDQGDVTIAVTSGSLNHTAALYVKPAANYWEQFVERPNLDAGITNIVTLQPLAAFPAAGFPAPAQGAKPFLGWGQRIMGALGLDPAQATGAGVRVAIIDSGCDVSHPALSHITIGRDYTNLDQNHDPDSDSWRIDQMSHGTHCAGVIAGNGRDGHILGFAPQAEVHVLKVFPGGAFNNLVAAINYCIDNRIHVVNCSLGGDVSSNLVAQAIQRARQQGVALFVAAGNSGSNVQFPANVPGVLCVAAMGQAGNFPAYTYHARTVPDGAAVVDGQVYPAKFSCHGPQVSLCGPGVGIISSVPGGGYAAWDGTSMADPHLTGLGALVAAHHPALAGAAIRDAAWVDRLFGLIEGAAQSIGVVRDYSGAGLPMAPSLLGGSVAMQAAPVTPHTMAPLSMTPDMLAQLVSAVIHALPPDLMRLQPALVNSGRPTM